MAAEFDIDKLGYPVVNRADGIDWVIDGQHRTYALRKQHVIPSDGTIECEVYENLSEQQMADLFPGPEPEPARDRIRALPGRGHRGYSLRQRTGNHGTNWLIDGQHRMYALRKQADTKVWHLVVLSRFAGVSGRCLPSGPTPLVHVIEVIWRRSSRAWVAPAMAGVATASGRKWMRHDAEQLREGMAQVEAAMERLRQSKRRKPGRVRRPTAAPTASGVSGSVRADRARPRFRQPLSAPCRSQVPRQGPAR